MNKGKIIQVMGPVVDVSFEDGVLPDLYNAIHIERQGETGENETLVCEVQTGTGEPKHAESTAKALRALLPASGVQALGLQKP